MSSSSRDRTLVLVRHAKAEQVLGKADHDRALTERGRRDAQVAGAWIAEQRLVPELVICSTSVRTRETWAGLCRGGAHTEFVEYRKAVYQSGAHGVLEAIREDAGDVSTLLVVGHAPSVPDLASGLSDGEGSVEAHRALADGFPTCAVAVLSYTGDWEDLQPGDAVLDRFHVCRA